MSALARLAWTERLPGWLWLLASGLALMPVWQWCAARLRDGSDDPLGVIALLALLVIVVRDRAQFAQRPRPLWLLSALALAVLAVLGSDTLPALLRGVLAILALSSILMALRAATRPMSAMVGLGILALPLLSSLQFFIGYPLRVLTAEGSAWLLGLAGQEVTRSGSALIVAGQWVMVDAPCSGIQMGWMAYFTACSAAAWLNIADGRFVRRLPFVGLVVLIGNILRNSLLVMKEAGQLNWPDWTHEAVGVAAFAVVCGVVLHVIVHGARTPMPTQQLPLPFPESHNTAAESGLRALALAVFVGLTVWPHTQSTRSAGEPQGMSMEWPLQYEGRRLRPLALSAVEQRFAERFPGAIGRFHDGQSTIVMRQVNSPTRMLHPASDCFRGLGYRISQDRLVRNQQEAQPTRLQRCFVADKDGSRLQVCEYIVDAAGAGYTDTSSWYWAALTGQTRGPWQAVTKARPI
jgi:exosortase/archaeosortase family protein